MKAIVIVIILFPLVVYGIAGFMVFTLHIPQLLLPTGFKDWAKTMGLASIRALFWPIWAYRKLTEK